MIASVTISCEETLATGRDKISIAKHFCQREYTREVGNECGGG